MANGSGSGSWASIGTSSFTGAIADFVAPIAPDGWLECNGSDISITTYAALFGVMTIQQTGTRTSGNNVISGLSSTTNMRVGYYVFGTGIAAGTYISSIDSATQIHLSGNASSSGSSTVYVSPWYMDTGIIRVPNLTDTGRFRRSRSAFTAVGTAQAQQNFVHNHNFSGNTGSESAAHNHGYSGTTDSANTDHTHAYSWIKTDQGSSANIQGGADSAVVRSLTQSVQNETTGTASANTTHAHNYSGTTGTENQAHAHGFSGTTSTEGGGEARPYNMTFLTCVKT